MNTAVEKKPISFKEYAKFYVGCEGIQKDPNGNVAKYILQSVHAGEAVRWVLKARNRTGASFGMVNDIQPLLRPLSNLTNIEALGLCAMCTPLCRVTEILEITNDGVQYKYDGVEGDGKTAYWFPDSMTARQFRLLLKAEFDLFNLIEAGVALDKSKTCV
jgi:hypothetical protein